MEFVPAAFALKSSEVYLLFATENDRVNAAVALVAPVAPSVTENVTLNAVSLLACGVIVNTLSTPERVVPFKEPDVTAEDHVRGNPSGSVETAVIVVAVPSVARL